MFNPGEYVRHNWSNIQVAEQLEDRARGYSGTLREVLCTAARILRERMTEAEEATGDVPH